MYIQLRFFSQNLHYTICDLNNVLNSVKQTKGEKDTIGISKYKYEQDMYQFPLCVHYYVYYLMNVQMQLLL